jgi:hypothetical protein
MSKPVTYKPWVDGRGQPTMKEDAAGDFVSLADYKVLEQRFYASNQAVHALEVEKNAAETSSPEATDGKI